MTRTIKERSEVTVGRHLRGAASGSSSAGVGMPARSGATNGIVLALCGLSLMGCNGAFWGNLVVLGVTVGIFFGTLALGRASAATRSADASSSSSTRR